MGTVTCSNLTCAWQAWAAGLLLYPWLLHCSLSGAKMPQWSPKWRQWNSLGKAVQRRQILGVSAKDPQCLSLPWDIPMWGCWAKKGLTELVRNQAGDARVKRDLQSTANNLINGIFLFYNKSTFIKAIKNDSWFILRTEWKSLSYATHLLYIIVIPKCRLS